jgi:hypothetical protein
MGRLDVNIPDRGIVATDPLVPVGEDKANSIVVDEDDCVILTEHRHFNGQWLVLGAGRHNSLEYLNNRVYSLVAFKGYSGFCFAERDIPMLYEKPNLNGWKFPIVEKPDEIETIWLSDQRRWARSGKITHIGFAEPTAGFMFKG